MAQFTINTDKLVINDCIAGILVQENSSGTLEAILLGASSSKQDKHTLHALAQMAYYQFQDDEITPLIINGKCSITNLSPAHQAEKCLLIIKSQSRDLTLYHHDDIQIKKYLEAAHRYTTRWIRLDI